MTFRRGGVLARKGPDETMLKKAVFGVACLLAIGGLPHAANGQGGSIGASVSAPECGAKLEITSVKFLGKADKTDKFEVEWSVSGPQSGCLKIVGFEVGLSITRKRGNVDTAKNIPGSARKVTVEIPRATLETRAASFQANLTALTSGFAERTIQIKGNGPPVLAAGAPAPSAPAEACNPTLKFEKINFLPNSGRKDVVGIFWKADSPSPCLVFKSSFATVRIIRVDGRVEAKTVPGNLIAPVQTATVEFPAGAAIDQHEVTVRAEMRPVTTAQRFDTQKTGKFPD